MSVHLIYIINRRLLIHVYAVVLFSLFIFVLIINEINDDMEENVCYVFKGY